MTGHVLDNAAAQSLLLDLENRDLEIEVEGSDLLVGPRSALGDTDLTLIKQHKATLIRLVEICDDGVQERLGSFKGQLPSTAPVLITGIRYVAGVCFSCGVRHDDRRHWGRCWRCWLALRLVLSIPIPQAAVSSPKKRDSTGDRIVTRSHNNQKGHTHESHDLAERVPPCRDHQRKRPTSLHD